MDIRQLDVLHAVSGDPNGDNAVLAIFDDEDWCDECGHLMALQAKLNAYLDLIQSGQLTKAAPMAASRRLRIDILSRLAYTPNALKLVAHVDAVAKQLDVRVRQQVLPEAPVKGA